MILCVCPNPSIDSYSWIDQLIPGDINRVSKQTEFPGGKGIHVALALKEIGAGSSVLGFWGGATGSWIKEECQHLDIACYGPEVKGSNRRCYTFRSDLAQSNWNMTELLAPGPDVEIDDYQQFVAEYEMLLQSSNLVCLSGSWPEGSPLSAYEDLIIRARNVNKPVVLDASGSQLENALKAKPYGLHLNYSEATILCQTDDLRAILRFLSPHVELVALTMGKGGLYLMHNNRLVHANTMVENVISTVGSGDCLTAGIAYGIDNKMSLEDIARWGVACGAANCVREDLGMLYREDVNNFIENVHIEHIAL